MPLYEFKCNRCGHRYERLCGFSELPSCPRCGDSGPKRLFSLFATGGPRGEFSQGAGSGGSKCSTCGGGNCSTC